MSTQDEFPINSHDECVVAEYASYEKAKVGLQVLDLRGFEDDTVSVVARNDPALIELERARRAQDEEPSKTALTGVGAAIAGGAAAPIAIGALMGPFFLVGPIAAALAGAAAGSVLSGTKKWGVNEETANSYQQRVQNGSVLVIVHASGDELIEAHSGLKTTDTLSLRTFAVDLKTEM